MLKGSAAVAAGATVVHSSAAFAAALQEASGTLIFAQSAPITSLDPVNPQGYPAGYEAEDERGYGGSIEVQAQVACWR